VKKLTFNGANPDLAHPSATCIVGAAAFSPASRPQYCCLRTQAFDRIAGHNTVIRRGERQ
jgi:hypothetical protein